jgi:hypothetical protein
MESLVQKYGEAAKESEGWASALTQLEQLIPGVTAAIEKEGTALGDTTNNLKEYIEQSRKKAVEDAKQATIGKYREAYANAQVALGQAEIDKEVASYEMNEAASQLAQYVQDAYINALNKSISEVNADEDMSASEKQDEIARLTEIYNQRQNKTAEELMALYTSGVWGIGDLSNAAKEAANFSGDYNQSPIDAIVAMFNEAQKSFNDNAAKIGDLTAAAETYKAQLDVAEAAVARMAEQSGSYSTDELKTASAAATSGLNHLASEAASFSAPSFTGEGADGSHAIGDRYIPYDNYVARLHRGEMVLTSTQARRYRNGEVGGASAQDIASAVRSAVMDLAFVSNGETIGRVIGDQTTNRVNRNIGQMSRRHRYGYGG